MTRAVAIELIHLVVSLGVFWTLFYGAVWSYPVGRATIWQVGYVTLAVVLAMGVRSLWRVVAVTGGAQRGAIRG